MPASATAVNPKDGSELVRIPAGEFELGASHHDPRCRHRVHLSEYWIGRALVTNRQYHQFVRATRHAPPTVDDRRDWLGAEALDRPVVEVSWEDAAAYAAWAGLALPTDAQWEKAAAGPLRLIWRRATPEEKAAIDRMLTPPGGELSWLDAEATPHEEWRFHREIAEWCQDRYDELYWLNELPSDPPGPAAGTQRVVRCAGQDNLMLGTGVYRKGGISLMTYGHRGFRVVRNA